MNLITGNRKFFITLILIFAGIIFLPLAILWNKLTEIAVHYYTFLGVIGSAFLAANISEHVINKKGLKNDQSNSKVIIG
jgi:hypothetical protein